ncbi:hypothetical protein GCM10009104_20230 [Marinobacterium maritimum]|uniref:Type II secretion system protein H n=1 Tax=Marinobacterium maritimum TaxID=500162 RepID=A0ABN1I6P7_9GAMM
MPVNKSRKRHQGFSVIEMMVAIAVLSIIVGIGIPSFKSMMDRSRIDAAADDLADGLRYARSEALQRNTKVTLKDAGSGFVSGWSVVAGSDTLRKNSGMSSGVTTSHVDGNGVSKGDISFDGRGVASASTQIQVSYSGLQRCIKLTLSGSVRQSDGACN